MIRQFSAGGIVLRQAQDKFLKGKAREVLLVKNASIRDKQSLRTNVLKKIEFWGFPKGHIEKGQTTKDAALREVREEGGIEAKIVQKIGESKYVFTQNGEKIFKIVTMFLMNYLSGDTKDHDHEILEAAWFDPEEALKILSFKNDKDLLKKALELKNG